MKLFRQRASGCGFIVVLCASMCLMLIINSALVLLAYDTAQPVLPAWMSNRRVVQAVLFAGPVLMIVVEWWLYDMAADLWHGRRKQDNAS